MQKPLLVIPQPARYEPTSQACSCSQPLVGQLSLRPPGPMKTAPSTAVHGTQLPADDAPHPWRYCPLAHGARAEHRSHVACPPDSWYSSSAHGTHSLIEAASARIVPAAHALHT